MSVLACAQVPVLFTGSLRFNLTPFGEHSDAECWAALRRAHLADMIEGTGQGLDLVLTEGGAPLSAGQKQLVALARALLRHSKVDPRAERLLTCDRSRFTLWKSSRHDSCAHLKQALAWQRAQIDECCM